MICALFTEDIIRGSHSSLQLTHNTPWLMPHTHALLTHTLILRSNATHKKEVREERFIYYWETNKNAKKEKSNEGYTINKETKKEGNYWKQLTPNRGGGGIIDENEKG